MGWALFGDINTVYGRMGMYTMRFGHPQGLYGCGYFLTSPSEKKRARGCGPTWRGVHGLSNAHRATVYDA